MDAGLVRINYIPNRCSRHVMSVTMCTILVGEAPSV